MVSISVPACQSAIRSLPIQGTYLEVWLELLSPSDLLPLTGRLLFPGTRLVLILAQRSRVDREPSQDEPPSLAWSESFL